MKYEKFVLQKKKITYKNRTAFNEATMVEFGVSVAKTSSGRQFLTLLPFWHKASLREFGKSR